MPARGRRTVMLYVSCAAVLCICVQGARQMKSAHVPSRIEAVHVLPTKEAVVATRRLLQGPDAVTYTLKTGQPGLCAAPNTGRSTTYVGYICDTSSGSIEWEAMSIIPDDPSCNWARGNDAAWNADWDGGCGVAPSAVPNLPILTATVTTGLSAL
ncbi:hypothetical protein FOA52_000361 [Chlamydomonas sp. UWO 241]|nr:hypothetical protein FOA52_000361 [Chlamydomonas sp. UWO 241]